MPFKSPLTPAVFEQMFCSFCANFVALKLQFACWRNKWDNRHHLFCTVARFHLKNRDLLNRDRELIDSNNCDLIYFNNSLTRDRDLLAQGSPNFNIVEGERARLGGERAPKARVS